MVSNCTAGKTGEGLAIFLQWPTLGSGAFLLLAYAARMRTSVWQNSIAALTPSITGRSNSALSD